MSIRDPDRGLQFQDTEMASSPLSGRDSDHLAPGPDSFLCDMGRKNSSSLRRMESLATLPDNTEDSLSLPRGGAPSTSLDPVENPKRSWVQITCGSLPSVEDKLIRVPPGDKDSIDEIIFNPEDVLEEAERWTNTLVVHVAGQRPYFPHFMAYLRRVWRVPGGFQLYSRDNGCFLVKFVRQEECKQVIDRGPWLFDGRVLILKLWQPSICLEKDILTRIPLWIRMPEFPLLLWSRSGLSRVASKIGTPLRMDTPTATRSRLAFARVFVEVSAEEELLDEITLSISGGGSFKQQIVYEWKPLRCNRCVCFGHSVDQCRVQKQDHWAEKKVQSSNADKNKLPQNDLPPATGALPSLSQEKSLPSNKPKTTGALPSLSQENSLPSNKPKTSISPAPYYNRYTSSPSRISEDLGQYASKIISNVNRLGTTTGYAPKKTDADRRGTATMIDRGQAGEYVDHIGDDCTEQNGGNLTMENAQWKTVMGSRSKGGKSNKGKGKAMREEESQKRDYFTRGTKSSRNMNKLEGISGPGRPALQ